MLYDNTTVEKSWVAGNTSNMASAYEQFGRIVNNVTLSMPHAGLHAAARDPKNGVLQPEELARDEEYLIEASVVSPAIHVLHVNLNATGLAPLIYTKFPNARTTNTSGSPGKLQAAPNYQNEIQLVPGEEYLNVTVVDDIFGWVATYNRNPPVFPMVGLPNISSRFYSSQYPMDYNSITSITVDEPDGDAIYMLIKAPSASQITPSVRCDQRNVSLPELLPSVAQALAVMAGSTLLTSSNDASFYHFWNYTADILRPGVYETFNASITSQQYTSGVTQ
ncbi:hypothetical protein B2J93_3975 [Marssonina coronariae]|uniref:Uncharacterized protein n=1 Tax=Diplocarpon coronariae TaxID=2795749 RepID=A0A218YWH8_9HELO|nr:hypothetical protein B2J93_3975 [Marssonina coronariae]